jgi:hypothetical protein
MRKQIMAVMLPLLVVTALAAPAVSFGSETKPTFTRATAEAFLASSKGAKSDLCEYEACGKSPSALEWATAYAARDFGGKPTARTAKGRSKTAKDTPSGLATARTVAGLTGRSTSDPMGKKPTPAS